MSNWSRRNPFDASHDNPLPTTSYGVLENGAYVPAAVTPEGYAKVDIASARPPFGSIHTNDPEITLQPGEQVTVAVRSLTTVASCFACLNTREDQ